METVGCNLGLARFAHGGRHISEIQVSFSPAARPWPGIQGAQPAGPFRPDAAAAGSSWTSEWNSQPGGPGPARLLWPQQGVGKATVSGARVVSRCSRQPVYSVGTRLHPGALALIFQQAGPWVLPGRGPPGPLTQLEYHPLHVGEVGLCGLC